MGHSLIRSLIGSHHSLVRLFRNACVPQALRCAHWLAHELMGQRNLFSFFIFSSLPESPCTRFLPLTPPWFPIPWISISIHLSFMRKATMKLRSPIRASYFSFSPLILKPRREILSSSVKQLYSVIWTFLWIHVDRGSVKAWKSQLCNCVIV